MAGTAFCEVHVLLFVVGTAFGELYVSLFVAAQHEVKFGMIAGAGNVVIFNRICSRRGRKVPLAARRVQFCIFRVGLWSDRSHIGNNVSAVLSKFLSDVGWAFCVAGAICGWRVLIVAPCILHFLNEQNWNILEKRCYTFSEKK